jgi:hypothetical protein
MQTASQAIPWYPAYQLRFRLDIERRAVRFGQRCKVNDECQKMNGFRKGTNDESRLLGPSQCRRRKTSNGNDDSHDCDGQFHS